MKQITVKQLAQMVVKQLEKGNGDKIIVISDDNEGNSYHGMFFGFTEIKEDEKEYYPIYDSTSTEVSDIIILG